VDGDPTFMTHHTSPYFLLTYDCIQNSSATELINSGTNNGCDISTTHLNPSTNVRYNDFNVTFHPYQYTITNNVTLRTGNVAPPTSSIKPFVYMSNDENMSVHLNTTISAVGKDSTTPLSNYVTGCFAKPLSFEIAKSATNNAALRYSYRVHNLDINGTVVSANDINQTIAAGNTTVNPTFTTTSAYFHKNMSGVSQIRTNLNFDRDVNVTTNPEDINYTSISAEDNASLFNADLTNSKYAEGNVSVNQRVLHYYGRTISPKITVICNNNTCRTGISSTNNNNIKELISYVIYCEGASCNSSILPVGALQVADARWFENRNHDRIDGSTWLADGTDGTIGAISEVAATGNVYEVAGTRHITANKYETEAVIEYSGPLPYDAIMQMQSSPWLINNENDANATANTFIIQFVGDGGWSGKYEDNTTTKTNFSRQTNRRIMW
jgi:Ni,Fe-hydrogenase III small subunit